MDKLSPVNRDNWIETVNAGIDIRSKNTKEAYKKDLHQFVELTGMDLLTATETDYLRYFKELEARNYRYSTIARKITALSKYLDYLVIAKRLPHNPIDNIRKVSRLYRQMDRKVNVEVTISDIRKVIRRSRIGTTLIIQTLANTGIRISELIGIRKNDVKVNHDYAALRIKGKGKKERTVYISLDLYNDIRNIFNKESEYLFHSATGNQLIRQNLYKQIHGAFKKWAGKEVHPHSLRHFCATHRYVELGEDIKAVSSYLGHSSTGITLDMYVDSKITPEKAMIV
jgi:integrase/recombinase XerD